MDRSFLTNAGVVAASRQFVCIRLATYESQAEADFMKKLYLGRSGQLENTTFAILAPDGKTKLTRAGRGPQFAFGSPRRMSSGMDRLAKRYSQAKKSINNEPPLPLMKNLDLALNVAAADGLPVLAITGNAAEVKSLSDRIRPVLWSRELAGQFVIVQVTKPRDLQPVIGSKKAKSGLLFIRSGQFGLSGTVTANLTASLTTKELHKQLIGELKRFPRRRQDHNSHIRLGIQLGLEWKSQIPETDPMSLRARQRARGR